MSKLNADGPLSRSYTIWVHSALISSLTQCAGIWGCCVSIIPTPVVEVGPSAKLNVTTFLGVIFNSIRTSKTTEDFKEPWMFIGKDWPPCRRHFDVIMILQNTMVRNTWIFHPEVIASKNGLIYGWTYMIVQEETGINETQITYTIYIWSLA